MQPIEKISHFSLYFVSYLLVKIYGAIKPGVPHCKGENFKFWMNSANPKSIITILVLPEVSILTNMFYNFKSLCMIPFLCI